MQKDLQYIVGTCEELLWDWGWVKCSYRQILKYGWSMRTREHFVLKSLPMQVATGASQTTAPTVL